jgi:DNA-binding transcriptional ArsR family regulator
VALIRGQGVSNTIDRSVWRSATREEPLDYAELFAILGDARRIEILRQMLAAEELACTTLEETLPVSKPTISYHIARLYRAGLIDIRQDGRRYYYRLRRGVLDERLPGFLNRLATSTTSRSSRTRRVTAKSAASSRRGARGGLRGSTSSPRTH